MFGAKDRPPRGAAVSCRPATLAAFLLATPSEFSPAATTPLAVSPLFCALTRPRKCSFCTASSPFVSTLTRPPVSTSLFSIHTKDTWGGVPLNTMSFIFNHLRNPRAHNPSARLNDLQDFAAACDVHVGVAFHLFAEGGVAGVVLHGGFKAGHVFGFV